MSKEVRASLADRADRQAVQQRLTRQFGGLCRVRLAGNRGDAIVSASSVAMPFLLAHLATLWSCTVPITGSAGLGAAPATGGGGAAAAAVGLGGAPASSQASIASRLAVLTALNPSLAPRTNIECMQLMAAFINTQTNMFVYGGYLRDWVARGDFHQEMDLDVGIPSSTTPKAASDIVANWALKINITVFQRHPKGAKVLEVIFIAPDGSKFPVEFVDTAFFSQKDSQVDFDVNNLKLTTNPSGALQHKYQGQGGPIPTIVSNCSKKQLTVLKPPSQISGRITKMQSRGWKISFGN